MLMTARSLRTNESATFEVPARLATSDAFEVLDFKDRDTLYSPAGGHDRLYLLRTGRVRLVRAVARSHAAVQAILSPGDVFGGPAASASGVPNETAVASGDCAVWSFNPRSLQFLCEARPQLARELVEGLAERQRDMARRLEALTFKEVPARLAGQILALADDIGEASTHGGFRDIRGVTQQDLADLVGASRSFVSTLVNDLKRDGILRSYGRTIVIADVARLQALAALDRVSTDE